MELKWLEDLLSVAEKGHFARAADDRNVTQSALSRRIKSLEFWVGIELLDRSQHPIQLTEAGRIFSDAARNIVSQSYEARATAQQLERKTDTAVSIACLHTLALFYMPDLVAELHAQISPFEVSIVAETRTIEEYLESLVNGTSDFFCCYTHASFPFSLDPQEYDRLVIGTDRMTPYQSATIPLIDLSEDGLGAIPYLSFSGTAFMSRVVESIIHKSPFLPRLNTVYRSSLAESLSTAAAKGLGVAWLPESVGRVQKPGTLKQLSLDWSQKMNIVIYRSSKNERPIVEQIWAYLKTLSTR